MIEGKYLTIWQKYLPVIRILLKKSTKEEQQLTINKIDFETVGERGGSGYSFNLEIEKGKVMNGISGTAVARDLFKTLTTDPQVKEFFLNKKAKVRMNKQFMLIMNTVEIEPVETEEEISVL